MTHQFDVDIATAYGVNAAILFQNIFYWCEHNKANELHYHDGLYWTYNTLKAFNELFPYMTPKQIRTALKKLEEDGLIVTGNYNTNTYDRTKWYAIAPVAKWILPIDKSICPKGKMDFAENENGFDLDGEPIPYINTDSNTDNKQTDRNTDDKQVCGTHTPEKANGEPPVSGKNPKNKKPKEEKERFGEYDHVLLTLPEIKRLVSDYGAEKTSKAIQFLDEYIEEKGYKSKSHYLAIRRWVIGALDERQHGKSKRTESTDYDWNAVLQSLNEGDGG